MTDTMGMAPAMKPQMGAHAPNISMGGHLYMQTNEIQNAVLHYRRSPDGCLTNVDRVATGGAGSGVFKPISGQESAPNAFEGAGSVILSPDRKMLFATNGGDNTVSSFMVGDEGHLTLIDCKPTGNKPEAKTGTAKSLAFCAANRTLYVLHSFGPDHLRLMSVDADGKLTPRDDRHTVNTVDKDDRVPTMVVLAPNGKFLVVGTTFDRPIAHVGVYPDGSPILWVPQADRSYKVVASNAPDPDGIIVFPVGADGTLGAAIFQDAKGASPFYIAFLHNKPDTFVIGYAVSDGCALAKLNDNGMIDVSPISQIDTGPGLPSELCWVAVAPDDKTVYATNFGYSYVSSFHMKDGKLQIACDPACPKVPGDGTARGLNTTVTSGPADNWISPDGGFFYQIYGNAAKLVGYATELDGSLTKVSEVKIPYNSPQGLAGY